MAAPVSVVPPTLVYSLLIAAILGRKDSRLLGYLEQEPADDQPRGFLLPHLYETRTGAIADLDSGATVESEIAAGLDPGTLLRVTTYGDVVAVDEASGTVRVATVTASEWFPGQLG